MTGFGKSAAFLAVLGAAVLLAPAPSRAQAATDLDCKKCVGAKDIAKQAVKTNRLQDSAVETSKIANGAVTRAKIRNGAVTFAKLAEDAVFMRVRVASPVGPTAADNCGELLSVLADITDNTESNRFLVQLEPGLYDCGDRPVRMKSFVDIAGAGVHATEIRGSGVPGVVSGASDAELRGLTVRRAASAGVVQSVIVGPFSVDRFRLTDVAAVFDPGTMQQSQAVLILGDDPVLTNVHAEAFDVEELSPAVQCQSAGISLGGSPSSHAIITNVTAKGGTRDAGCTAIGESNGLVQGAIATIRNSVLEGEDFGLRNGRSESVSTVLFSQLIGGTANIGTYECASVYDGDLEAFNGSCVIPP